MSVRRDENGTVILEGLCPIEDAEPLLQMLQATPTAAVDWTQCRGLHTAVLQVIVAARPPLVGDCGNAWMRQWIEVDPA